MMMPAPKNAIWKHVLRSVRGSCAPLSSEAGLHATRQLRARRLILSAALLLVPPSLNAAGALNIAEVLSALAKSNPSLVRNLQSAFDLDNTAVGVTIGKTINQRLGGARGKEWSFRSSP